MLAERGGWQELPTTWRLAKGSAGPQVVGLKERLAIEGDLDPMASPGPRFDDATAEAVRRFQRRVGLMPSGQVAAATLRALNVPAYVRVNALEKSLARLAESRFAFGSRYVVVNIPATAAEAVEEGVVARRHAVIVGKPEHPSPMVETRLTVVNFNPTWTIPTSIIRRDIIPKMQRDPQTLAKMRVRILNGRGEEVDPKSINWNTERAVNFTLRQDPGAGNSLGRVRVDMPNREAVFMHDTPSRRLFVSDARFFSSGCVRVADVADFVAWLLGPQGYDTARVNAEMTQPERKDVRLRQAVPVAWVYLTGWAAADGTVSFRDDIYGVDAPGAAPYRVIRPADRPSTPVAPPVQQAPPPPPPDALSQFWGSVFRQDGTPRD
jgi:murein L,D-transpeptidase YcbB/YkuD